MGKEFNITGTCIPEMHYMVDTSKKLKDIIKLIDKGKYFIINRPRQYGKTTTLFLLNKILREKEDYLPIKISFEGIGDVVFEEEKLFSREFLQIIIDYLMLINEELSTFLVEQKNIVENFNDLSKVISKFILKSGKKVVLTIDEVDKSSNNRVFLSFLAMLRNKYLQRNEGVDYTFHSVILAGVHDVKSLKLKIRNDEEHKYNSPWNIASDFQVDMSFSPEEISTMLREYSKENNVQFHINSISEELHLFTQGYPFLVSRLCQIIDEKIYEDDKKPWTIEDIQKAVKLIVNEDNTLFQSIVKNLENNNHLYDLVRRILVNNETIMFNILDPLINLGVTYGIFRNSPNGVVISNKIFEEVLYNYMISKLITKTKDMTIYNFKNSFITADNGLDIEKILKRFKQYMKENYSSLDINFIEREGRLIFLAFITPIINGVGFALKEVQISEEKRLDLVITYNKFKYIIEMKIWRGTKYHEEGIKQLCDYLDIHDLNKGYLLIFNFNKNKEFKENSMSIQGKDIFEVYV